MIITDGDLEQFQLFINHHFLATCGFHFVSTFANCIRCVTPKVVLTVFSALHGAIVVVFLPSPGAYSPNGGAVGGACSVVGIGVHVSDEDFTRPTN